MREYRFEAFRKQITSKNLTCGSPTHQGLFTADVTVLPDRWDGGGSYVIFLSRGQHVFLYFEL